MLSTYLEQSKQDSTPNYVRQTGTIKHLSINFRYNIRSNSKIDRPCFSMERSRRMIYTPISSSIGYYRENKNRSQIAGWSFFDSTYDTRKLTNIHNFHILVLKNSVFINNII